MYFKFKGFNGSTCAEFANAFVCVYFVWNGIDKKCAAMFNSNTFGVSR